MYSFSVKLKLPYGDFLFWFRRFGASTTAAHLLSLPQSILARTFISYFSLRSGKQVLFGISSYRSGATNGKVKSLLCQLINIGRDFSISHSLSNWISPIIDTLALGLKCMVKSMISRKNDMPKILLVYYHTVNISSRKNSGPNQFTLVRHWPQLCTGPMHFILNKTPVFQKQMIIWNFHWLGGKKKVTLQMIFATYHMIS